ncbi:hypothetical protein ASPWEDRAFT_43158 [Aspergillus wentii DTO 134E9]|uniref:Peroxisomal membrane protein PEX14-like KPWE domain-containing protein n=1 Tax=Aspergillus wentii DTO 134E9 TaxID=1073089 RepID=A0A1L9RDY8_ASPWE|nr:uncharacterized protein ASPWEDRAFT_43158 [Aspergillus wentii DTO 134E9]OJJ33098.1 hypothetical protein ASPWEDRAFT_43158 [Aspergillus wentii DTO 134E9]
MLIVLFSCRKQKLTTPLNFAAYKSWSASNTQEEPPYLKESSADGLPQRGISAPATESSLSRPNALDSHAPSYVPEPTYPSSFAHIVELITTGQPIPGIQQIPNTVLTGHDISSAKPRRLKPWEKECDDADRLLGNDI